jgi:nucleotide-binding universal stress UspA family protein
VNTILVPSDGDNELSLHAVFFAFEFAKRTDARVLFLTVARNRPAHPARPQPLGESGDASTELTRVISSGRERGLDVETHVTSGDYVAQVTAFARDHHVSRVVVALPEHGSESFSRVEEQVNALRNQLGCVLVTVRPRRDRLGGVAEHQPHRIHTPPTDGER